MKKFLNLFFLLPLAIVLILLSVANRKMTTFSLDPMSVEAPALAFQVPLFVLLFLVLVLGMFIGSALTWVSQGKHRKALRQKSHETNQLKREKEETARKLGDNVPQEIAPGLPLVSRH